MIKQISDIIYRKLTGSAVSVDEQRILDEWLDASTYNRDLYTKLTSEEGLKEELRRRFEFSDAQAVALRQFNDQYFSEEPDAGKSYHRKTILRMPWIRYAAAILLIIGAVSYLWNRNQKTTPSIATVTKPLQKDIQPAGEKAILTLADGTTISLDSASNGRIASQGASAIVKLNDGQISYQASGSNEGPPMMNTMSTPKGGQYKLTLPDGSRVWLDAASSITYPAVFTGNDRNVHISGEVYFEIAKDPKKPFIVGINTTDLQVRVLGTHFNVMAYPDEQSVKTTLVEGSVRIRRDSIDLAALKPGQQGEVSRLTKKIITKEVDVDEETAWVAGFLVMNNSDIASIMRRISRWYDVEVQYRGAVESKKTFGGLINRNINLSQMIQLLQRNGINTRLEGRMLIVE